MAKLCVLYLMSFLDRTNIGNAKIAVPSLQHSLGNMSTGDYNACLTIFFVSYALAEPLTNVLLKRLRPSIFLPIIMYVYWINVSRNAVNIQIRTLWGLCMMSMGFVKNWSGLMAARFFLGLCEAGLYPGVNYFLSCWYKRSEFGIRAVSFCVQFGIYFGVTNDTKAIFFSAAAVSGSFGGLLAAAITNINGRGGYPGWAVSQFPASVLERELNVSIVDFHHWRGYHGRHWNTFFLPSSRLSRRGDLPQWTRSGSGRSSS